MRLVAKSEQQDAYIFFLFESIEKLLPSYQRPVAPKAIIRLGDNLNSNVGIPIWQVELFTKPIMRWIPLQPRDNLPPLPNDPIGGAWVFNDEIKTIWINA